MAFGLYPKDFGSDHTPFVNSMGELSFTKYSVATTNTDLTISPAENEQSDDLILDVNLQIPKMPLINNRFSVIFSINDKQGESQMLLGQWKNYLVLMSGDDYSNKTGQARITVPLDSVNGYDYPQPLHVQIHATQVYTSVTINEQQVRKSTDYRVPLRQNELIVSLGNTLDRKKGWAGTVRQFELSFSHCPSENSDNIKPACTTVYHTSLLNVLQDAPTTTDKRVQQSTGTSSWVLQPAFSKLSTQWLSSASLEYWQRPAFYKDTLINLLGFVPITLAIFFVAAVKYPLSVASLITITTTFAISLLIESIQIYLPSRTSSIVDLMVNSLAGVITTLICIVIACTIKNRT